VSVNEVSGELQPGGESDVGPPSLRAQCKPLLENTEERALLGESQLKVLRRYGTEHDVVDTEVLFAAGDQTYDMIVLLQGKIDIIEHFGEPNEVVVITYGPREFLGEMGLLTGLGVYLTAVATADGRILRISAAQVKVIMFEESGLSELILRAFLVRHSSMTSLGSGPVLVGSRFDLDTRRLLTVFARNRLSSRWLELGGSREAEALLRELDVPIEELPVVVLPSGSILRNPSSQVLMDALGLTKGPIEEQSEHCDLLIVGGGPGGLAAAVYAASEGLVTTLAEGTALGGQAGTSSRIENYLGFPAGLSGEELTARAVLQAEKFGVRIKLGANAVSLTSNAGTHHVQFDDADTISAKSVIVATGARYNRLPLDRLTQFEGAGVYYAATQIEARDCLGGHAVVVGGGNSAGQAALFLIRTCAEVHILIRSDSLVSTMSRYLIDQIARHPHITIWPRTEVVELIGEHTFDGVTLRDNGTQETSTIPASGLFVFIGAKPCTEWLAGQLADDSHGFLLTGRDVPLSQLEDVHKSPLTLETSRPGVFCIGDVRSRSVKRVAAAVGEGSTALQSIFERLDTTGLETAGSP